MAELTFAEKLAAAKKSRDAKAQEAQQPKGLSEAEQRRLALAEEQLMRAIEAEKPGSWVELLLVKPADFLGAQRDLDIEHCVPEEFSQTSAVRALVEHCRESNQLFCEVKTAGHRIGNDGCWLRVRMPLL